MCFGRATLVPQQTGLLLVGDAYACRHVHSFQSGRIIGRSCVRAETITLTRRDSWRRAPQLAARLSAVVRKRCRQVCQQSTTVENASRTNFDLAMTGKRLHNAQPSMQSNPGVLP